MPPPIYLVDGHAQLYMAYHALEPLAAPDGSPTGAVFGFLRVLRKVIAQRNPGGLAVALDAGGPTFRHVRYAEYKAHRPPMPDALRAQEGLLREVLAAWPIPVFERTGYEADDLLATLVRQLRGRAPLVIVTLDKDARALLAEGEVEILDLRKDRLITERDLKAETGLAPAQWADYLALVGDTSDNVPGVRSIGPKTASALLAKYGTLDVVLEQAGAIGGRIGEALAREREVARLSRQLTGLDAYAPIEAEPESLALRPPDAAALGPLFRRLGFTRLLDELGLARASAPPRPPLRIAETAADLTELAGLVAAPTLAVELALDGEPRTGRLHGIGLVGEDGPAWYLPLDDSVACPLAERRALAGRLLGPSGPPKRGHDLQRAQLAAGSAGLPFGPLAFDARIASALLAPLQADHSLGRLATSHLGIELEPEPPADVLFDELVLEPRAERATGGAYVSRELARLLPPYLERRGLAALHDALELPLAPVLARMEAAGLRLDLAALAGLGAELATEIERARAEAYALAGHPFNLDSPRQLADVLFDQLCLPVTKRTPGGSPSTDADVLEELATEHPLPAALLGYRQLVKLQGTYVEALPRLVDPSSGRVHTRLHALGTSTGRISSEHPNLQNIPIRSPLGQRIRRAFVAPPGALLMSADYSQVELRILAHLSGDEALRAAFHAGQDIHRAVAARVAGIPEDQVDGAARQRAKAVNFGIVYGQTPFGLARELGIDREAARAFIDQYFDRFPRVRTWIEACLIQARESGEVRTMLGRVRPLPDIRARDHARRAFAERTAVNTVVQGTAADLLKRAMVTIDRRLSAESRKARLVMTIHDELLLELAEDQEVETTALVREEMGRALALEVPLEVSIGTGRNWLDAGKGSPLVGATHS